VGSTFDFAPKSESVDREDLGFGCGGVADLATTAGFLSAVFDVPNREKACALGGGANFDSTFGFEPNKELFGRAFGFDFTGTAFFAAKGNVGFCCCGAGLGFGSTLGATGLLPKNENGVEVETFFSGVGDGGGAGACLGADLLKNDIDGFGAALGAGARGTSFGFGAASFGSNTEDKLNVDRVTAFFLFCFSSTFGVEAAAAVFLDAKNAGEVGLGAEGCGVAFGDAAFG